MSNLLDEVIALVLKKAADARDNAGYSGAWDDGGAHILEEQVKWFNYGRVGTLPKEWQKFHQELEPEFKEYLRLKGKYGG